MASGIDIVLDHSGMLIPAELQTARLVLRPWRAEDAAMLQPILEANQSHLAPWIPAHVAEPASLPRLAERLAAFAADFMASRAWRFALVARDDGLLLGEASLFPRSATSRVAAADADRAEVGYWLRADRTGAGLVTEAARALVRAAAGVSQFSCVEIHCDARNAASGAVAARLGFSLASHAAEPASAARTSDHDQVWRLPLTDAARGRLAAAEPGAI